MNTPAVETAGDVANLTSSGAAAGALVGAGAPAAGAEAALTPAGVAPPGAAPLAGAAAGAAQPARASRPASTTTERYWHGPRWRLGTTRGARPMISASLPSRPRIGEAPIGRSPPRDVSPCP